MSDASQPATAPADASKAIQEKASPMTADGSIPLPPRPGAPSPDPAAKLARQVAGLDWALVVVLVLLAGLLGFCAAHFSRLWMHLASGRLLAHGQYQFGVDPFSWGTQDLYWVNGTWLTDLLFYVVYSLSGGTGLVVLKALLIIALALLLFQVRRLGASWWPSAFCVGLALLTMSPRFQVDPFLLSLLLLGATVYLLFREPQRPRSLWLLPPLFTLWANLDSWFILGPLTVALVLLGEWLQQVGQRANETVPVRQRLRTLGLVLPVGLLACLVNPHLYHVFVLPPELADLVLRTGGWLPSGMLSAGAGMREIVRLDPRFLSPTMLWLSPLSSEYWSYPFRGLNAAGLAYFPLLLLGLGSFALTALTRDREQLAVYPWSRLLLWGFFAVLSVAMARLIPLFAVVAGPITALNLQDFRQALGTAPRLSGSWRAWSLGGRAITFLGLLALALLTWPGWLHPISVAPPLAHRVGWQLEADPLLREAAEYLDHWQGAGKLGPGFNYNIDIAYYCAWFGPNARPYYDGRLELFAERAKDIGELRRAVRELATSGPDGLPLDPEQFRELLRKHGLDHLDLTDYSRDPLVRLATIRLLKRGSGDWPMLHADGRAVIFGCVDPDRALLHRAIIFGAAELKQAQRFRDIAERPNGQAFGRREPLPPPPASPGPFLAEPDFWHDLLLGPPPPSGEMERANFWSGYFDTLVEKRRPVRQGLAQGPSHLLTLATPTIPASIAPAAGPMAGVLFLFPWLTSRESPFDLPDVGPPAAPLLALQAARRATFANPTSADAYNQLLGAIERLWIGQESHWAKSSPHDTSGVRSKIRRLQWTAAAQAVLRLDPERYDLHLQLARMYIKDLYYLDIGKEHFEKALDILRRRQPQPGQAKALEQQRKQIQDQINVLSAEINRRREWLEVRTLDRGLREKVTLALLVPYQPGAGGIQGVDQRGLGLARQALKFLQAADPTRLTPAEGQFNLYWQQKILLDLGEVKQVHDWLNDPALEKSLSQLYTEGKLNLYAIVGDYRAFDQLMQKAVAPLAGFDKQERASDFLKKMLRPALVGQLALDPRLPTLPILRAGEYLTWQGWLGGYQRQLATNRSYLANNYFIRGLMALEGGDTALALRCLRQARDLLPADEQYPDRGILERYLKLLEEQKR
jgi:hypothetical protein